MLFMGMILVIVIIGALYLLWYCAWAAGVDRLPSGLTPVWKYVLDSGWLLRLVTLSSLVVRIVVAAQSAILTEMLSCLVLEGGGCSLPDLAKLSITRCQTSGPFQMALTMRRQLRNTANTLYAVLFTLLLATTISTQFVSTILLTDFASTRIAGDHETHEVNFANRKHVAKYDLLEPSFGVDYWKVRPIAYYRFAEYSTPPVQEDGVFDTGSTFRALLPLQNATERTAIHHYVGPATVFNARVVCVRPHVVVTYAEMVASRLVFNGTVTWHGEYKDLRKESVEEVSFSCRVDTGYSDYFGPAQRKVSICDMTYLFAHPIASLPGGITSSYFGTRTFLIANSTVSSEEWAPHVKIRPEPENWWGPLDITGLSASGGTGAWQSIRFRNSSVGIDAVLCFANPEDFNLQIAADSFSDGQEPSLRWNISTGNYGSSSLGVRDFLGASSEHHTSEERGILRLQPQRDWYAANTDDALGLNTSSYVCRLAWQVEEQSVFLNLVTSGTSVDEGVIPHRGHIGLFQDILMHTDGNAALALQALWTTLMQTAYYDYLGEHDATGAAAMRFSREVLIPVQWDGFNGFCAVMVTQMMMVFLVAGLFLARSTTSLLGNAWQAVAQVSAVVDDYVLVASTERTDSEVEEYIRCQGGLDGQVRVRPSVWASSE